MRERGVVMLMLLGERLVTVLLGCFLLVIRYYAGCKRSASLPIGITELRAAV